MCLYLGTVFLMFLYKYVVIMFEMNEIYKIKDLLDDLDKFCLYKNIILIF